MDGTAKLLFTVVTFHLMFPLKRYVKYSLDKCIFTLIRRIEEVSVKENIC